MNRNRIALLAVLLASALSCESPKVLWVRVDATLMTIRCVDQFELVFRATGATQITGASEGTWREGAVTYRTEVREGIPVFVIYVTGNFIRQEVPANADRFPGQFVFELPLQNMGGGGSFVGSGAWIYMGVTTGTAQGGPLILPDSDSIYSMIVTRTPDYERNLCLTAPPDADVTPEEVEEVEEQEGDALEGLDEIETAEEEGERMEAGEEALDRIETEGAE